MAKATIKEEVKKEFELPVGEKVIVKYIPRKKGMAAHVSEDHIIAGGMIQQAVRKFRAPLQKNGSIANVLTKEEKDYLEERTGLDLSVYKDFWADFAVTLTKDKATNTFYLENPMDYIAVKLLETLKDDIAPSWKQRDDKLTYQFVITRGDEEGKERKKSYDSKKEAFKQYGKIEDDRDKLLGVLKLLSNKPISRDSKLDWIQGQVEEYIDTIPTSFLSVINDPSFDTKILVHKGLEYGVIVRSGNKYATVDGLDLCESDEVATFATAVRYLDNPRNQDVRTLIEAKINNAE